MSKLVGAFVFPTVWENWSSTEAADFFKTLQAFGVNAIATESESYRDDLIELAHKLGLQFVGGISCFSEHGRNHQPLYDQPALWPILETGERRPLMEWYIGVTPTIEAYREGRLAEIERIAREHDLDAVCLDFIRWPMHWEIEMRPGMPPPLQSSFDPISVAGFLDFAGLEMPSDRLSVREQAAWILTHHRARWTDFKCHVITQFVAQARERIRTHRAHMRLGAYLVPAPDEQRAYWVGQRAGDLAAVTDFLSPMVYHPVIHQTPEWVVETINEMTRLVPGKVLPVLQVDSAEGAEMGADWGRPVPVSEWQQVACATAQRDDIQGFIAFTGTSLLRDNRGDVLARCLQLGQQ